MLSLIINGSQKQFPVSWLRENCRCQNCFFESGHQRLIDPYDPAIESASLDSYDLSENALKLTWEDGHKSKFDLPWLIENGSFLDSKKGDDFDIKLPWNTTSLNEVPKFDYSRVMSGEEIGHAKAMAELGFFVIQNAPT